MQSITVDGRQFRPIKNGTFAHDIWLMQRVRNAGLATLHIDAGETEDAFMERIATAAWESGAVLELLGGAMVPAELKDTDWTAAIALDSAKFFGSITDEDSKQRLRTQIGGILFYFFISGLSSSKTSTKSGAPTDPEEEPHETEASFISAIGDT